MDTAAIIPAAGRGSRLGLDQPKAFVPVDGVPMVVRTVGTLVGCDRVDRVIVAAPPSECAAMRTLLDGWNMTAVVVPGGASRQASVAAALAACPDSVDAVLVHDAARCFAPPSLIESVIDALAEHGAVIPVLPVADTLRRATITGGQRVSAGIVDRSDVWRVQTPQGFRRELLARAYAAAADRSKDERSAATDDAALVEELGEPVTMVAGDDLALKITTPHDLLVARLLASVSAVPAGADDAGTPAVPTR